MLYSLGGQITIDPKSIRYKLTGVFFITTWVKFSISTIPKKIEIIYWIHRDPYFTFNSLGRVRESFMINIIYIVAPS